jgi:two-component system, NtrC family, response regulator AtoC
MSDSSKGMVEMSSECLDTTTILGDYNTLQTKVRVLVVDNDSATIRFLQQHFSQQDFVFITVNNGFSAIELMQSEEFDILLSELTLPRMTGLQLLSKIKSRENCPEVILISGQPAVEAAVEAIRMGAVDFLTKPLRLPLLQDAINRAHEKRRLVIEHNPAVRRPRGPRYMVPSMTQSPKMKEIAQLVTRVAKSNSTILITGDSGVGKEVIAHAIHGESLRCNSPFTDISCAAIPETLLESEMFGYEKGSFTGADSSKPGLFELATGGTLFLDEIGEIGPVLQTKLLRVIETRSFYRVGGTKQITVDVRILAATNKDLKQAVKEGKFRKDLFYRLNTINIEIPPLRDHREDVPLLVHQFLEEFDCTHHRRFSDLAIELMKQYPWPGNVRELRNMVERVLLISPHMLIDVEDLPKEVLDYQSAIGKEDRDFAGGPVSLIELEKRQIANVLQKTRWHRGRAAELLAISPKTLYRKIKQYDLDKSLEVY